MLHGGLFPLFETRRTTVEIYIIMLADNFETCVFSVVADTERPLHVFEIRLRKRSGTMTGNTSFKMFLLSLFINTISSIISLP